MTWFKVDDKLHSHPKAIEAGEAAMGLWVMAGSWAADQLSDGFVPDYIVARLSPKKGKVLSQRLVTVRLWSKCYQGNVSGFRFHEWDEPGRQPSRAQVLADRKATAQRQQKWRDTAKEKRGPSTRNTVTNGTRNGVTNAVSNGLPDPTPPKGGGEGLAGDAEPDPQTNPLGWMEWQRRMTRNQQKV